LVGPDGFDAVITLDVNNVVRYHWKLCSDLSETRTLRLFGSDDGRADLTQLCSDWHGASLRCSTQPRCWPTYAFLRATGWRSCLETESGITASESISNGASASAGRMRGPRTSRSLITTKEAAMASDAVMEPVHPGEILNEEFLAPLKLNQYQPAKQRSTGAD